MAITVRDLMALPYFEGFTLIAGKKGLDRLIGSVGILDFEYSADFAGHRRSDYFFKNDFLFSNLFFAKENHMLLLETIQELNELGVSCLAFKTIAMKDIPDEVKNFANRVHFPIYKYGEKIFMEEAIYNAMEAIKQESRLSSLEGSIERMIDGKLSQEESAAKIREINPHLFGNVITAYVKNDEGFSFLQFRRLFDNLAKKGQINDRITLLPFDKGLLIIATDEHHQANRFDALLHEAFIHMSLDPSGFFIGYSEIHPREELDLCFGEAYFSWIAARIERANSKRFGELGDYRILIPGRHSRHCLSFMKNYLAPLLDDGNDELLQTAIVFVLQAFDLQKTAEALFCHTNTIRYRINRIRKKLAEGTNEHVFYEHLAIAIKIYLLKEYK